MMATFPGVQWRVYAEIFACVQFFVERQAYGVLPGRNVEGTDSTFKGPQDITRYTCVCTFAYMCIHVGCVFLRIGSCTASESLVGVGNGPLHIPAPVLHHF